MGWDIELVFLNYFITRLLEKNSLSKEKVLKYKNIYFDLVNNMATTYESFDSTFIQSLFDEEQTPELNLEEQLLEITKKIYEKRY